MTAALFLLLFWLLVVGCCAFRLCSGYLLSIYALTQQGWRVEGANRPGSSPFCYQEVGPPAVPGDRAMVCQWKRNAH